MKPFWRPVHLLSKHARNYCATENLPILSEIKRSSPIAIQKKKKEPFMKNVFIGKFDQEFLTYPEIAESDLMTELSYKSNLIEKSFKNEDGPIDIRDKVRFIAKSGFLSEGVPKDYGGLDLRTSEVVALSERISFSNPVSLILETQHSLIIQTLLKYASSEIKKNYLSKILSGEMIGAYALFEGSSFDPLSVKTLTQSMGENIVINGEKRWVNNADMADFFIVFAKSVELNDVKSLSAYIVERNKVEIVPEDTSDVSEFGFSKLLFKNLTIPIKNRIGNPGDGTKIAFESLSTPKYFICSSILSSLKNMFSTLTRKINFQKLSPNNFNDCESEQFILAKIGVLIYVLESMLYFTTLCNDIYDIDLSLESLLLFACFSEVGKRCIIDGINLLGAEAYESSLAFNKMLNELSCLSMGANATDIHKMHAALIGLDYAVLNKLESHIKKSRNPFDFPIFALKHFFGIYNYSKENPKLNLKLYMNLHPSLKCSAEQLEYCVLRFPYVVQTVLVRHAAETKKRQLELNRIFQIAADIYAMTCVLSRASRAYCTGLKHSAQELQFANAFCSDAIRSTKSNIKDIIDGGLVNNDVIYLEISDDVLDNKLYFIEHPLKRNIV